MSPKNSTKGIFFTIDAVFALMAVLSIVTVFTMLSIESVSAELMHEGIYFHANDMIDVMAKAKLQDVIWHESAMGLYQDRTIGASDMNRSLLEVWGALWSSGDPVLIEVISNMSRDIFGGMVPGGVSWSFEMSNETIYNTTERGDSALITTVSRKLVSGYMKSRPRFGYAAKAYLDNIQGMRNSEYVFFGGFVGQGNLSGYIRNIPADANISYLYMEFNLANNFTLYINGTNCGTYNKTGSGNFSVDSWTINSSACLSKINLGNSTLFNITFVQAAPLDTTYVGGGFMQVVYSTGTVSYPPIGTSRYYFPGIDGVINLYDSFYVPGNVTEITGYLRLRNKYNTTMNIGSTTVYNSNGTGEDGIREIYLTNDNFSALGDYIGVSDVTVPLRLAAAADISGGLMGDADVILITDISGSMAWRVQYNDSIGVQTWNNDCTNPNMYTSPDTQRLALAKCLDKEFIGIVLNGTGNRIGLVAFSDQANNYRDLTTDQATLVAGINLYAAGGGTCICCGINRAYERLQATSSPNRKKFIVVMSDGIAGIRCNSTRRCNGWEIYAGPTSLSNYFYDVSFGADNVGYAVGTSGYTSRWNGATWSDPAVQVTTSTLYGVSFVNSTLAYAVGAGGRIMKWNNSAWSVNSSTAVDTLRDVDFANSSFGFAVGLNGRILRWMNGQWTIFASPGLPDDWFGIHMYNGTLGFVVGEAGRIARWDGTSWANVASPTGNILRSVEIFNETLAFATGDNIIIKWNGAAWATDYTPTTNMNLYGLFFVNSSRAYAVGFNPTPDPDEAEIIMWSNRWYRIPPGDLPSTRALYSAEQVNSSLAFAVGYRYRVEDWRPPNCQGTETDGTADQNGCCGGQATDCSNGNCECAMNNAIWSSWRAYDVSNITVNSIGFGPIAGCVNANYTLYMIAQMGNGTYNTSDDPAALREIYHDFAERILINATVKQEVNVTGLVNNTLYPESYLQFRYNYSETPLGYREISVDIQSTKFPDCNGTFFINSWLDPYEAAVTSYSANYWTHNVTVNGSATGGDPFNVYNLSKYLANYTALGDAYRVQFPARLLAQGGNNNIHLATGVNPMDDSIECPQDNRAIYKAKFQTLAPYSDILPLAEGANVTVWYDVDGDGIPDGNKTILLAYGLEGIDFNPAQIEVSDLSTDTNALHDAFLRLLDNINFNTVGNPDPMCCSDCPLNRSGTQCNPIDIEISPEIDVKVTSITEVPYMWGPIEISVVAWVQKG